MFIFCHSIENLSGLGVCVLFTPPSCPPIKGSGCVGLRDASKDTSASSSVTKSTWNNCSPCRRRSTHSALSSPRRGPRSGPLPSSSSLEGPADEVLANPRRLENPERAPALGRSFRRIQRVRRPVPTRDGGCKYPSNSTVGSYCVFTGVP